MPPHAHEDAARGKERSKIIPRIEGEPENAYDDHAEKPEKNEDAKESPFLGVCREYEIGLVFREELKFRLRSIAYPLAEEFSGAQGDGRLRRCSPPLGYQ